MNKRIRNRIKSTEYKKIYQHPEPESESKSCNFRFLLNIRFGGWMLKLINEKEILLLFHKMLPKLFPEKWKQVNSRNDTFLVTSVLKLTLIFYDFWKHCFCYFFLNLKYRELCVLCPLCSRDYYWRLAHELEIVYQYKNVITMYLFLNPQMPYNLQWEIS